MGPRSSSLSNSRAGGGGGGQQELEYYVIRLLPEQSTLLYGYMRAKTTLTWRDVSQNSDISMRKCIFVGIPADKLCRMQPDIREWMRTGRARLQDCELMGPWKPNVFTDLGCCIGDLVLHRHVISPQMIMNGGGTFEILKDRYGLTPEIMALLRYTAKDWLDLGVPHEYLKILTDEQWIRIFSTLQNRCEMLEMTKRRRRQEEDKNNNIIIIEETKKKNHHHSTRSAMLKTDLEVKSEAASQIQCI